MKRRLLVAAANIGFMFLLVAGIPAEAAELKVLSALGMQAVMGDLGPKFERATGHTLVITFAPLGGIVMLVQDGATGDVVMIPQSGIERLAKDGKVVAGTETVLARSGIGVAVRKGAPKPDISSPEALKRALLAAKSISYSDPAGGGASGLHFAKVLDRLGIADEMRSKTIFAKPIPDGIGLMVANGEAEIGVGLFQGFIAVAGIELVGPLPGDLQDTIVFVAAIMASAKQTEAGKALIDFLRTLEAAAAIKAKGMEPATP
jgi:molybdate transport system substrate-binding protein